MRKDSLAALLGLATLIGILPACSKERALASLGSVPALQLVLRADRTVYNLSDTPRLRTELTNVGKGDVYIWDWDLCWNPARGLSMRIVDAQGNAVQGRVLLDCVPPPPREGDVYQFLRLEPQRFYGLAQNFTVSDLVNKPGEYDIAATFTGSLSPQWVSEFLGRDPISKLPLWTTARPTIASNRTHIKVRR